MCCNGTDKHTNKTKKNGQMNMAWLSCQVSEIIETKDFEFGYNF